MNNDQGMQQLQTNDAALQSRIAQAEQTQSANELQHAQGRAAEMNPAGAQLSQQLAQPMPERQPQQPMPEWKPQPVIDGKEFNNFAMGIMALGLIGGVASKDRWMNVASSLNGAMEGYLSGKQEVAQQKYNDYKTQFEAAKAKEQQANKEFEDLLKRRDISIRDLQTQYEILAHKWQRVDAIDAVRRKDIQAMYKSVEHYDTSIAKLSQQNEINLQKMELQLQQLNLHQQQVNEKGWQAFQKPDGSLVRVNPSTGEQAPFAGDTKGLIKPGGRNSVQQLAAEKIVKTDIAEIDYGLEKIGGLKSKTGSPFFFQSTGDESHSSALSRFTNKKLTTGEEQKYDVYANRIAAALAGLQSQGRYKPSEAQIQEAKKLVPVPGDKEGTIASKLETIQRMRDIGHSILGGGTGAVEPNQDTAPSADSHPKDIQDLLNKYGQ